MMLVLLHIMIYIIIGLVIYILIPPSAKIRAIKKEIEEDTNREQESIEYVLFYTIIFLWPIIGLMVIFLLISKTMIKYFGRKKE